MIILGLNAHHADSSAALFVDGKLIAAVEEERFTRMKHWAGFPAQSVQFCLKEAGISLDQVDQIAIGRDPSAKSLQKLLFLARYPFSSFEFVKKRFFNQQKVSSLEDELKAFTDLDKSTLASKIQQVEHHRSHMASTFFASPFEKAAILSIDGSGDFSTTMIGYGIGNDIQVIDSLDFPHSLGIFYTAFTQLLGFPHYGDEYKVMGLAPYGKPIYLDQLRDVVKFESNGLFSLNLSYFRSPAKGFVDYSEDHLPAVPTLFNNKMMECFGPVRAKESPVTQYHKDLAASVQRMTEETIFHILHHLHKITNIDKVCIAGGIAQNSVANGKITSQTPFKEVYIPSAGHDAGISMGAALYVQHQQNKLERQPAIYSAFTGPSYSNEQIGAILKAAGLDAVYFENAELYEMVTDCLIAGNVVGWFNGKAEFGPRALGGRSILMDPRRTDAKEILNQKIKRRESFRPFAPSILKEYVNEFFERDEPVPFMEKVFKIRTDKRELIPAVTHSDGTGRLQTVDRNSAERYHDLINSFRIKTGIPILLNTSFNENEPIVNTPQEAINCFLRTQMDMLVLENYILLRN
jgi:carbamoyltransferase